MQRGQTPGGQTVSTDQLRAVDGGTELTVSIQYALRGGALGRVVDALFMRRALAQTIVQSLEKLKSLAES